MRNIEAVSGASETGRNVNAEWAILKEKAEAEAPLSWEVDWSREEGEREKYRAIGAKLLRVIGRMPDRMPVEEKAAKLDRLQRLAEGVGIGEDFKDALATGVRSFEKVGRETFGDRVELSEDEEARVEGLREKVIDLTEMEPGSLAEAFPSGNYLFHGSTIQKIEKIFATGGLKNGVALAEDDPEISGLSMNSGFEGISWSMDGIDALPGTRGHIAGFLAAPEDILNDEEKLVIPSRPAPYEVLQISEAVRSEELYALKNQCETWGDGGVSMGEKNSVDSNIMWMVMYKEGDKFFGSSRVYNYDGDKSAEKLREYFTIDDAGEVIWDEDLYQKFEVPPALPWFQSLIDSGRLAQNGFEKLDTVDKILEYAKADPKFVKTLLATERADSKPLQDEYAAMLDDAGAIRVRPEEMYFVTSHGDLEAWLKVMARTGVEPKGILLYDDRLVMLENFASKYEGNHEELGAEIGRAIGVDGDFWTREMGMDPRKAPRSGSVGQVLLESEVRHDRSIKLVDGNLEVVREG